MQDELGQKILAFSSDQGCVGLTYYDGEQMFHMAIAEVTKNNVLMDMVKDLWER